MHFSQREGVRWENALCNTFCYSRPIMLQSTNFRVLADHGYTSIQVQV